MIQYKGQLIRPKASEEEKRAYVTYANSIESIFKWAQEIFYPSGLNMGCPRVPKEEWNEVEVRISKVVEVSVSTWRPEDLKRIPHE